MKLEFDAWEYTKEDTFIQSRYCFDGDESLGWTITRENQPYLKLGIGYVLVQSHVCGICSTDLDRRFLPFPLPQIIGHEAIVSLPNSNEKFAVEINDAMIATDEIQLDPFCKEGLSNHSPNRMVLGIDRLPGGFGQYMLVPRHSLISIDPLPIKTAVLLEPFSAALQALYLSPPVKGDKVAVLGPRKLGSLLVAALKCYKNSTGVNFEIHAIGRHKKLLDLTLKFGADKVHDLNSVSMNNLHKKFDIVYDTTATASGLEFALNLSKSILHLKSTNGQEMIGLKNLTPLVVDELSILPFSQKNLNFQWNHEQRKNIHILISPNLKDLKLDTDLNLYYDFANAENILKSKSFQNRLPRFDLSIVSSLEEIDYIIRPSKSHENSLIRPRGCILYAGSQNSNPLLDFIQKGGILHSSRCGNFQFAKELLSENLEIARAMQKMITSTYSANNLKKAFQKAKQKDSVKVIVSHGSN